MHLNLALHNQHPKSLTHHVSRGGWVLAKTKSVKKQNEETMQNRATEESPSFSGEEIGFEPFMFDVGADADVKRFDPAANAGTSAETPVAASPQEAAPAAFEGEAVPAPMQGADASQPEQVQAQPISGSAQPETPAP